MTREEAKTVFLNRGYVEVEGGTIYDADKWRESCRVISEWLEQEPTITSTEDNAEMIYPQVEGITPTVVEPIPDVDKKVESYGKLLKHPVVKHIMDEEQEQIDFVQPHKRIPVTLTVGGDCISRQEAIDTIRQLYIDLAIQKYVIDILKALPSVKPQESKTGHWEEVGEEYIQVYDIEGIPSCGDERRCSECGFQTVFIGEHTSQYKYCPKCGARMESEQNE